MDKDWQKFTMTGSVQDYLSYCNKQEIKNDMTKERRGLRHDVVYEVFCFLVWTALFDYRERIIMSVELSITHNLSISFK